MNKVNYLALGAAALAVISILLPWVEVTISSGTSDLTESVQTISIHGVSIGYGLFGLLLTLAGGFAAYKEFKWTFVAGLVNFINGYGYLHGWFGKATHDSGNYGDVTSLSSIDHKFGLYLFILSSLAFMIFTLKNYKPKKKATVLPSEPNIKENQPAAAARKTTIASHAYKPSKIQTMTTSTSETPIEPVPAETPQVPVQAAETATEQPAATPVVTEPVVETPTSAQPVVTPPVAPQPVVTPAAPVQAVVPEPAPVAPQAPVYTAAPQQPVVEPKKSSTSKILLIILAIALVGAGVFVMTNNSSEKSKDKTEQAINDEKTRLDVIIKDVNQAVSDKKYDDALLKINSINWLYDPTTNKGYVDQYNAQRENLRNTVMQLKDAEHSENQQQANQKAAETTQQPVQTTDSIH
jgi:glycerol-3-phosphate cytidylyltransferase-like family protein